MKKKKLTDVHDIENKIVSKQIKPYCSVEAEASLIGSGIKIELQESIRDADECYIVAYDKKEQRSLAIQRAADIRKKTVKVSFATDFIRLLTSFPGFKYARLCMVVCWEEKYAFFYLNKIIKEEEYKEQKYYVGNVAEWVQGKKHMGMVAYYSAAGLLSMKQMEIIHYPKKYIEGMLMNQASSERNDFRFELEDEKLVISRNIGENSYHFQEEIALCDLESGERVTVSINLAEAEKNRILWIGEVERPEHEGIGAVLCCYTNEQDEELYVCSFNSMEQLYKKFLHFKCDDAKVWVSRKQLHIRFSGNMHTKKVQDISVDKIELAIDDNHQYPISFNISDKGKRIQIKEDIDLKSIIAQETVVNNSIHLMVWINGICCQYNIGNKSGDELETKYYYIPSSRAYVDDWAVFIRQNVHQNYVMVVRKMEPRESTVQFWLCENLLISFLMYYLGKIAKKFHKKNVNLYFEKDSMKAEEGAFEVFRCVCEYTSSRNYYILDTKSEQWEDLSRRKNVIRRYSLKYYWLLYSADFFISTEMSSHLNIHRATNRFLRRALLDAPLIFLQHGITYLKRQGNNSVYGKGKEGEPKYIVVGSEKEKQIVCNMLQIDETRCVKTGLPIFSTIQYEHIKENSEDLVTIMFTWKPSEEHLQSHFEDSTYYEDTKLVYETLQQFLPEEQIRIVPHPKVRALLMSTELKERIWTGTVAEVLKNTKLLITDYSSVCYNSFYQGGAVVFYQPSLVAYELEVGKLIPKDEEYIGCRVFEIGELERILQDGIKDQVIDMKYFRTEQHKKAYMEINEFCDGKNVERIISFLQSISVV